MKFRKLVMCYKHPFDFLKKNLQHANIVKLFTATKLS